ncbi:hypothetical protein BS47DRAFT_1349141 [Hydnum rufescens UP504]|uniref:Uncharacterized protein n=1 Tax=Hydnum rufescens UP504 TaxID=1448309 RepID=A0A9P6APF3_9AGAM|nr:hypothetical protein BS47DRAFT_1349141 [Hydnum rufescens UP504]
MSFHRCAIKSTEFFYAYRPSGGSHRGVTFCVVGNARKGCWYHHVAARQVAQGPSRRSLESYFSRLRLTAGRPGHCSSTDEYRSEESLLGSFAGNEDRGSCARSESVVSHVRSGEVRNGPQ